MRVKLFRLFRHKDSTGSETVASRLKDPHASIADNIDYEGTAALCHPLVVYVEVAAGAVPGWSITLYVCTVCVMYILDIIPGNGQ